MTDRKRQTLLRSIYVTATLVVCVCAVALAGPIRERILIAKLDDKNPETRLAAARTLGSLGSIAALSELLPRVEHHMWFG